jgi:archaetidylinositol phosphate synthase
MTTETWTHRLARPLVRPLVGTGVTPNHLTTLRLLTGLAGCAGFLSGDYTWQAWGGVAWVLSVFLDCADGELARIGNMMTARGHAYDFTVDLFINAIVFLAIGIGLRESWLGPWAILLGAVASLSVFLSSYLSEAIEKRQPTGTKAYEAKFGFEPDDAMFVFGPLAWLDWFSPVLVAAAVAATAVALVTAWRLQRLVARQDSKGMPHP